MISKDKEYRTRDGDEVRIYATDGEPTAEVHGAYKSSNGHWIPTHWDKNGIFWDGISEEMNLIEVKPRIKREFWVNIYEKAISWEITRKQADKYATDNRIACVKVEIDCEEGEGLS